MIYLLENSGRDTGNFDGCTEFGEPVNLSVWATLKDERATSAPIEGVKYVDVERMNRKKADERFTHTEQFLKAFYRGSNPQVLEKPIDSRIEKEKRGSKRRATAMQPEKEGGSTKDFDTVNSNATSTGKGEQLAIESLTKKITSDSVTALHMLPCSISFSGISPIQQYFRPLPLVRAGKKKIIMNELLPRSSFDLDALQGDIHCLNPKVVFDHETKGVFDIETSLCESLLHGRWIVGKGIELDFHSGGDAGLFHEKNISPKKKARSVVDNSDETYSKFNCFIGQIEDAMMPENDVLESIYPDEFIISAKSALVDRDSFACVKAAIAVQTIWEWEHDGVSENAVDVRHFLDYLRASSVLHSSLE